MKNYIEINTGVDKLYAIPSKRTGVFDVYRIYNKVLLTYEREYDTFYLPKGNLKSLGMSDELTEEQWLGIVKCFSTVVSENGVSNIFRDYVNGIHFTNEGCLKVGFSTAKESGLSLLESHGIAGKPALILKVV